VTYRDVRWQDEAACLGMDTELFFGPGPKKPEVVDACARCTVKDNCLQYALDHEDMDGFGIWGGRSYKERKLMRGSHEASGHYIEREQAGDGNGSLVREGGAKVSYLQPTGLG
jgi:hypothetical protein